MNLRWRNRCGTLPQKLRRRAGISLGELLIVISLSSILMTVAGVLIQELLRADRAVRRAAQTSASLLRLESLFRDDVHRAVAATAHTDSAGEQKLELVLPEGQRVTYSAQQHRLKRVVSAGDRRLHFDRFAFPEQSVMTLAVDPSGAPVELQIDQARTPVDRPPVSRYHSPRLHRIVVYPGRFSVPGGQP